MTTDIIDAPPVTAHPWRTIWYAPRRTMRELLAADPRPGWTLVVGLAALHGALATLGGLAARGDLSFNMAVMPTVLGVLQVIFGVLIGPFLLALSGGWFGGQADPAEIRQSLVWSYAPLAVTAFSWIPVLMAGAPAAAPDQADLAAAANVPWLLLAVTLVYFAALLWTLVLQVVTLAEVQHFSIPRSLVSIVVWMIPLMLLSVLT